MTTPVAARSCDVLVAGDGPAGAAIATACASNGLDAVVVGPGEPWTNTYAAWLDELDDLPGDAWAGTSRQVIAGGRELLRIDRAYGTIDNARLRAHLGLDDRLVVGNVVDIEDRGDDVHVRLASDETWRSRWVVDATGAEHRRATAWQTAYGVVVPERAVTLVATDDAATLMDWSWSGTAAAPSFLYAVPVEGGWLVEHTVLAAVSEVDPLSLRATLVERLGSEVVEAAEREGRFERVRIPMGVPAESGDGRIVRFGARAGMLHPATGYSLTASLRAAPRVGRTIAGGGDAPDVHAAVWPAAARRARALHDYGLGALLRLDAHEIAAFFSAFFALPIDQWAHYVRVDTSASEVSRTMANVFRRVPWSVRRGLVRGDWRAVARLLGR